MSTPQKKEVRLREELQLKAAIIQAIQTAFRQKQQAPYSFSSTLFEENKTTPSPPPFWSSHSFSKAVPFQFSPPSEEKWSVQPNPSYNPHSPPPQIEEKQQLDEEAHLPFFSLPSSSVIATLLGYCILDPFQLPSQLFGSVQNRQGGGLALLDQRAAYSRIHYERLLKNSSHQESDSLLIPITLQLSLSEFQLMQTYSPTLNDMGFGLREFGEHAFLIDAVPSFLPHHQIQTCLTLLLEDLREMQGSRKLQTKKEEQIALAACRSSLPADKRLSIEEANSLVQQLLLCDIPTQCPMGKPIAIYLSPEELGRILQKT